MRTNLVKELQSFAGLWHGGYHEGDPLDPLARSGYGPLGFLSVLHATYLCCIKPYVNSRTVAVEIGPGRGGWTKALLPAKEVYALDALPEEHNRFYEYLGHPTHVKYFQVQDFECKMLPDNHFTYMFSFGCLCHVSFAGISEYARNLFPKLKSGSHCFWMVADYEKYNKAMSDPKLNIEQVALSLRRSTRPLRWLAGQLAKRGATPRQPDADNAPTPGRWYDAGIGRTCALLAEVGYEVVDQDVGTCLRDPIVHFVKP